jgi:hypothetical protein
MKIRAGLLGKAMFVAPAPVGLPVASGDDLSCYWAALPPDGLRVEKGHDGSYAPLSRGDVPV